jgi:hypothetical protein
MISAMSGNHEHSGPPGEKPSAPPAGESEPGRAISASAPHTDDLDSEWDSGPVAAAPEKPAEKPSYRPGSVVVRTSPPPPMVAAGTDAGNTLLGVAPPAVAQQAKPVETAIPRAAAIPAEAKAAAPEATAPVASEPSAAAPEPAAPPAASAKQEEAAKPEAEPEKPKAESVPDKVADEPAPSAKLTPVKEPVRVAPSAGAADVAGSPDSVGAHSSDRRARAAEEPVSSEPPRSSRGLVIAAAAAVLIFGLWYGLRSSNSGEQSAGVETPPPAPVAQVSKAEPAQQPAPPAAVPAEAPAAGTAEKEPELAAPPPVAEPAAANGKKVVIVKVRPVSARFYYKGKKVGGSPMRVELEPGEKRAFEVGHPLFVTRKVVIDGSEPEVMVGLHPKAGSVPAQPKAPDLEPAEARP